MHHVAIRRSKMPDRQTNIAIIELMRYEHLLHIMCSRPSFKVIDASRVLNWLQAAKAPKGKAAA